MAWARSAACRALRTGSLDRAACSPASWSRRGLRAIERLDSDTFVAGKHDGLFRRVDAEGWHVRLLSTPSPITPSHAHDVHCAGLLVDGVERRAWGPRKLGSLLTRSRFRLPSSRAGRPLGVDGLTDWDDGPRTFFSCAPDMTPGCWKLGWHESEQTSVAVQKFLYGCCLVGKELLDQAPLATL